MNTLTKQRLWYLCGTAVLFITEVLLALYVQDRLVRPYLGDVLVVVLLYCIVRTALPSGIRLLPLYLFLLAAVVEIGQYLDILSLIGVGANSPLRIVFGTSFSWADMLCYAVGAALCVGIDFLVHRSKNGVP